LGKLSKQIDVLKEYIQIHGEDKFLQMTLSKMIKAKIGNYFKELREMENEFSVFEKKYKMSSEEFYKSYKDGKLDDRMDFHEWFAICDMYYRTLSEKEILEEALGE